VDEVVASQRSESFIWIESELDGVARVASPLGAAAAANRSRIQR
jgi:hypothetical protein